MQVVSARDDAVTASETRPSETDSDQPDGLIIITHPIYDNQMAYVRESTII
jgi:hypothetical protein